VPARTALLLAFVALIALGALPLAAARPDASANVT
jgi:hypothetical protein